MRKERQLKYSKGQHLKKKNIDIQGHITPPPAKDLKGFVKGIGF